MRLPLTEDGALDSFHRVLEEARKKIGIRKVRRLKKFRKLVASRARKVNPVKKVHRPWRYGAVHNRHRTR